jgi:hypothetical protein
MKPTNWFEITRMFTITARLSYRITATPAGLKGRWFPGIPQRCLRDDELTALKNAREEMERVRSAAQALSEPQEGHRRLRLVSAQGSAPTNAREATSGPYTQPESRRGEW